MIFHSENDGSNKQNKSVNSNNPYEPEPVRHGQPSWPGGHNPSVSQTHRDDEDATGDTRKESKWENKNQDSPNDRKI